jgi:1-aminocyclopropane-1-carboxylate deaminase/D-cysteine desulfhydrase-like pyridoxal-dependent ACC family enzyme
LNELIEARGVRMVCQRWAHVDSEQDRLQRAFEVHAFDGGTSDRFVQRDWALRVAHGLMVPDSRHHLKQASCEDSDTMAPVHDERQQAPAPRLPSPVEEVRDTPLTAHSVRLILKRDDLIHPDVPGNKWRKLKYNLEAARSQGHRTLLTFGGAYSNHIRATAAAGHDAGFSTVGLIRGEEHLPLNPSLAYAVGRGMSIAYMDRATYRRRREQDVIAELHDRFGEFYLLPEGGSNELAVRGCAELPAEIGLAFDVICCACGTGATLAGISAGLGAGQRALGFSALKGAQFLADEVAGLQQATYGRVFDNWSIEYEFHFGGFAKSTPELQGFVADFETRYRLALDWVYVAKMMYGIFSLMSRGEFSTGTTIVAVITGPSWPGDKEAYGSAEGQPD